MGTTRLGSFNCATAPSVEPGPPVAVSASAGFWKYMILPPEPPPGSESGDMVGRADCVCGGGVRGRYPAGSGRPFAG